MTIEMAIGILVTMQVVYAFVLFIFLKYFNHKLRVFGEMPIRVSEFQAPCPACGNQVAKVAIDEWGCCASCMALKCGPC